MKQALLIPLSAIDSYGDYRKIIKDYAEFLKQKFGPKYDKSYYHTWLFTPDDQVSSEIVSLALIKGGVITQKIEWSKKLDELMKMDADMLDYEAMFAANVTPNTKYEYILVGSVPFTASESISGDIQFFERQVGNIFIDRIMFAQYKLKDAKSGETVNLIEQTSDWEQGRRLIAMSINDFINDQSKFLKERVYPFRKKSAAKAKI